MMWKAKSAVILLMAAVVHVAGALKCEADHECLPDHYCYGEANRTRTCSPCVTCAFYKRAVLPKPTCARSALDCGDCLAGFQEEPLTASKRHYCMPAPLPETTAASPHAHVSGAAPSTYLVGSIISVFGVLLCLASFLWFRRKKISARPTPNARQDVEGAVCYNRPPPYEQTGNNIPLLETVEVRSIPLPALSKENESNEASYSLQVEGRSEQSLAKANPFKRAREPYHDTNNYSDQESSSSGLSDTENHPSPNAPDLNDEETMPSLWTYHNDSNQPSSNNAVDDAVEEFNDSGVSMPPSQTTSTGSLAGGTTRLLFSGFSFAGRIERPTKEVSASKQQQQSSGSPIAMKRARRNSSPVESTDSDEACHPDSSSLDGVMDPAITEDRTQSEQSTSCPGHNTTLPDSTRFVTGQGTLVFSFSFNGVADAARSDHQPTTQRVSTGIHHNSSDNGPFLMRVGPKISSTDDTEEDFVDNSSPSHVPPDRVM